MGNLAPDNGDQRWEFTVLAPGQNEDNIRQLIDIKGQFSVLGIELPEQLIMLLFNGRASREGARVVITLARVRDEVAGTMTVHSSVHATGPGGQLLASMQGSAEYGPRQETVEDILEHLRGLPRAEIGEGEVRPGKTLEL